MPEHRARRRNVSLTLLLLLSLLTAVVLPAPRAYADPFPPAWNGGAGPAVHYPPVAWPADAAWVPYSSQSSAINDQRTADPSNGGTAPQNHANVSSSCIDTALPSVYYQFDAAKQTIFLRWRVETMANTYATGPSAGTAASTDPWQSALWTVLFDVDGDGYREFAVQLNGSSGAPSTPVDMLTGIYSDTPSQSVDYIGDPANIKLLGHNPTAFLDASGKIFNFRSSLNPTASWPNGSAETVWDYGTTRATQLVKSSSCDEYLIDYQIPLGLLDATAVGGPKVTADTPLSFIFVTSNSLNNPLQKDAVINGPYIADPTRPAPFGDVTTLDGGVQPQPIVQSVTASGCGPVTLKAQVSDAIDSSSGAPRTTVSAVDFYAYADANANGLADDGGSWSFVAAGATTNSPLGQWSASWNSSALPRGQFLIGVKATDRQGNVTWSYLTQAEAAALGAQQYANPASPGLVFAAFRNGCGVPPPSLGKSATPAAVAAGQQTSFTITVNNTSGAALTVSSIQDTLPAGFSYVATTGGTLGAAASAPAAGDAGSISWGFTPPVSVPAGSSRTLVFSAQAAGVAGTFTNVATAATSAGALTTPPTQVDVGAPRLTIAKAASAGSVSPGDEVTYTITYGNDSAVSVTGAQIVDALPLGLSFVSASNGGVYNSATRTITWPAGDLAAGEGPFAVSFVVSVDSPYPAAAAIPLLNTAEITSDQSAPSSAGASIFVDAPRPALRIQKDADLTHAAAGGNVVFTLNYANTGNAAATGVTIVDPIPAGFAVQAIGNGGVAAGGNVTWTIGTVAAGATGSVSVTMRPGSPYTAANPATNTATISAANAAAASDSFRLGVTLGACSANTSYSFRSQTAAVGVAGTQSIATVATPTATSATTVSRTGVTNIPLELARFYLDPASAGGRITGSSAVNLYVNKTGSPQGVFTAALSVYDPASGTTTPVGSASNSVGGNVSNSLLAITIPAPASPVAVPAGSRLLWVITGASSNTNNTVDLGLLFDATGSPSGAAICVDPIIPVVNKQVNALSVQPGGSLAYTIKYANPSAVALSGVQLVDTLPAGVSFVSATGGGTHSNGVVTWNLGALAAGASGSLTLNVAVDAPLAAGIFSLVNGVTLKSAQSADVSDSAASTVARPNVIVAKAADRTLLIPGDTVTYTLTALNAGAATATSVTLSDTLPATAYFSYVAGSARLNGAATTPPEPVAGDTLTLNVGSLAPGASATVTFQMRVAAGGAPAGVTAIPNSAAVSDGQTGGSRASDPVTVSISTNPNLKVLKSAAPAGPVQPGDTIVYTLSVGNAGSSAAADVRLQDPIPANTTYVAGSLRDGAATRTDEAGDDAAAYDPAANHVVFDLGSIPAGATRTLQFTVRVDRPLAAASTTILNTATASASNTAPKQAAATTGATAAPQLSLVKSGPSRLPYPLTTLAAPATAATTVDVANPTLIGVNDVVRIGAANARVTAVDGGQLTLDTPVTAATGAQVLPTYEYVLAYANNGGADATNVQVADPLPAGLGFVDADNGGAFAGGTVTWSLGTVAAGQSGELRLRVAPTAAGSYANAATISSNEGGPAGSNTVATGVGALLVAKTSSTPILVNTPTGVQADYTIIVSNQRAVAATGVRVTDLLPAGFTYAGPAAFGGNAVRTSAVDPAVGDEQASWGVWSIPAGGTLAISFAAAVAPEVGPATYQNEVAVSSADTPVIPFDALATGDEDVTLVPAPPVAADDQTSTVATAPVTLNPPTNDSATGPAALEPGSIDLDTDAPGQQTTRTILGQGVWTLDTATGVVTFTAAVGFGGPATIDYTIGDSYGSVSNVARLRVDVTGVTPAPPVAVDDSAGATGTTPVTLSLLGNDLANGAATLDPASIDLDPTEVGQQASRTVLGQGLWELNPATGAVTFTPAAGFSGAAAVDYTVADSFGQTSNTATITVTVSKPAAPTANPDSASTTGTTPASLPAPGNDAAGGDGASLVPGSIDLDPATAGQQTSRSITGQGLWELDLSTGAVAFTPAAGFSGAAGILYTIEDTYGTPSNQTTLTVTVTKPTAPAANDDSVAATGTTPVTLAPASNDAAGGSGASLVPGSIDLDPITAGRQLSLTTAAGAWSLDTATGEVTFTAAAGFSGVTSIPYTIEDNYGTPSNQATLTVTVAKPTAPTAVNDSTGTTGTTPVTVAAPGNDAANGAGASLDLASVDLDPATAGQQTSVVTNEGAWSVNTATGEVSFVPAAGFSGAASIPYTIADNYGTPSNQATITVTVGNPAAPTAADDSTTSVGAAPVGLAPATNDSAGGNGAVLVPGSIDLDPVMEGQQTKATTAEGNWTLAIATGIVTFTPSPGFSGTASLPYTIEDNYGTVSNRANLTVDVVRPEGLAANDDLAGTTGTTPVTVRPADNDTPSEEDSTLVPGSIDLDPTMEGQQTSVSRPEGTWSLDPSTGVVTFTPAPGFSGAASLPYTIEDNFGTVSNEAVIIVTVAKPAAPTAADDRASTSGTTPVTLSPATNDNAGGNGAALAPGSIDLDPATPGQQTSVSRPEGTWSLDSSTGVVTFTPAPGFSGTASLPYTIGDTYGQTSPPATLTVTVISPTLITLNAFTATREAGGVVVRWSTGLELNTRGFHLYRSADGRRSSATRVTSALLPGKGQGQAGASYAWTDAAAQPGVTYSYWLEELDLDGARQEYGPATTTPQLRATVRVYLPLTRR